MRYMYYCTTPLQVFYALNMHMNKVLYDQDDSPSATMVLVDKFKNAGRVSERLKKEQIFQDVWLIREEDRIEQKNGFGKKVGILYDVIFPKRLIRQQFGRERVSLIKNGFDTFIASYFPHSLAALMTVNPKAEFVMMDDGLATYFGNWTKRLRSESYLNLLKMRNHGRDISVPKALYVLSPELCTSKITEQVFRLPSIQNEFLELAFRVFDVKDTVEPYKEPIVWIGHVSNNPDKLEGTRSIAELLRPYKEDVMVRLHPREKNMQAYGDLKTDNSGNMWELELSRTSYQDKLLITLGSTGVFTPKLMFDQEPWLLFAYKMIKLPNGATTRDLEQFVDRVREKYSCPDHVCVPDNWDEFAAVIQRYLHDKH